MARRECKVCCMCTTRWWETAFGRFPRARHFPSCRRMDLPQLLDAQADFLVMSDGD